ncbi:hypothetical protein Droror1_Dr00001654 [Drosera rotundifolia]
MFLFVKLPHRGNDLPGPLSWYEYKESLCWGNWGRKKAGRGDLRTHGSEGRKLCRPLENQSHFMCSQVAPVGLPRLTIILATGYSIHDLCDFGGHRFCNDALLVFIWSIFVGEDGEH